MAESRRPRRRLLSVDRHGCFPVRGYDHGVTREEYRRRIAHLRTLMECFRGDLECSSSGGSNGSISERTPDGKEYHIGGAVTETEARAIVAAVNFVRALCAREK